MVIDTSALIAIMLGEPERAAFIAAITADRTRLASAATMLETSMVILSRKGELGLSEFKAFVTSAAVQVSGFGPEHIDVALGAFRRFGKGRHPAGLNFGDCISYAIAKATGEALLFKGKDFPQPTSNPPYDHSEEAVSAWCRYVQV